MKKPWMIIIVVVLIVLAGLYLGRHQIKSMLGMNPAPTAAPAMMAKVSPTTSSMSPSDNIYKVSTNAAKGSYLTDFQGRALYIFDKDTAGVSNCTGQCSLIWPVYTSGATAQKTFPTNITVIKDSNGTMQFAWMGHPLYYYAQDSKPGDTMGDGIGGIWHLVKL